MSHADFDEIVTSTYAGRCVRYAVKLSFCQHGLSWIRHPRSRPQQCPPPAPGGKLLRGCNLVSRVRYRTAELCTDRSHLVTWFDIIVLVCSKLVTCTDGHALKQHVRVFFLSQTPSVHTAVNGYLTLLIAGKDERGEKGEWHPIRAMIAL